MLMRLTSAARTSFLTLMVATLCAVAGLATASALAPSPVAAAEGCEDDECELVCGFFTCKRQCVDNPGGNTGCSVSGGTCSTSGCGPQLPE